MLLENRIVILEQIFLPFRTQKRKRKKVKQIERESTQFPLGKHALRELDKVDSLRIIIVFLDFRRLVPNLWVY